MFWVKATPQLYSAVRTIGGRASLLMDVLCRSALFAFWRCVKVGEMNRRRQTSIGSSVPTISQATMCIA
jgi:hypothetical protein